MALTKRIHCLTDQEPTSYHANPAYALNLNIECFSDANVIDDVEAGLAMTAFRNFLDTLPGLEFHLYEVQANGGAWEAHHLVRLAAVGPQPQAGTAPIFGWLDSLKKEPDDYTFWALNEQTAALLDEKDKDVEQAHLAATHFLRGSHSWSAPVGHRFGLTRLLDATGVGALAPRQLIVLPHIPGAMPPSPLPVADVGLHDGRFDAEYNLGGALGKIICRANRLLPQGATPSFLTPEGFLKVNSNALELRRFLDAYERGWTGIVSSLPTLLEYAWPKTPVAWTIVAGTWTFPYFDKAWQVIAGLTTALDPMLIALLRPSSANGDLVVGDLLLPFVNDVLDAAAEMPLDKFRLTAGEVVGALRSVLRLSPLLIPGATQNEFITALRDIHGLTGVIDGGSAAGRLLEILLNAAASGAPNLSLSSDEVKALSGTHSDQGTPSGFAQDPYSVVIEATHRLHEEAGAEKALLRLFSSAAAAGGGTVPDVLLTKLFPMPPPDDADHAEFRRKLRSAWDAYGSRLEGAFNGEEAIRRSACADFVDVLQREAALRSVEPAPIDLLDLIEAANFFEIRLTTQGTGVFGSIANALPKLPMSLDSITIADLNLKLSYEGMLAVFKRQASPDAQFVADDAPAPLPIQVSASLSESDLDTFSADFNGICVALRRLDHPDDPSRDRWSHAHLAELQWGDGKDDRALGLRQWLPAAQDSRAPVFIDYSGFPFSSQTVARVSSETKRSDARRPFYYADVCEEKEFTDNGWAPLPRLIYGRSFEAFSFATTNSGSLPREIQKSSAEPWSPHPQPAPATAPIVKVEHSRRTNIGAVTIEEDGTTNGRIGSAIEGVRPLSSDYPRLALCASKGVLGSLDLLREPDGSGVLAFSSARGSVVEFADLQCSGVLTAVRVLFFNLAALLGNEDPVSLQFDNVDPTVLSERAAMTLELTVDETSGDGVFRVKLNRDPPKEATRPGANGSFWWIRIQLESKSSASISFANPFARQNAKERSSLLLMRPSKDDRWETNIPNNLRVQIVSPRVGFFDFERWYGNPELIRRTFDTAVDKGALLLDWLLLAYVRRKEPLVFGKSENFSSALDRLPDPAVEKLRLELVCLDHLRESMPPLPNCEEIDLKEKIKAWGTKCTKAVEDVKASELREMFIELAKTFAIKVDIESTGPALELRMVSDGLYRVNVPAGVVAELRVSSLVPKVHFEVQGLHPQVIHPGVAQSAVLDGDWQVFPGDALKIETMLDGLSRVEAVDLASRVISCSPEPLNREYKVISDGHIGNDEIRRRWRLVSKVGVSTQRWRPGGLPVYNMIDPSKFASVKTQSAAIPLRNPSRESSDELFRLFENEIFLARAPEEAETIWKDVEPQMPGRTLGTAEPARTVLQSIPWEAPSATYMRHRFQLRSRYAGALRSPLLKDVPAWPEDAKDVDAWTRRVAMLADRGRALVTRPQLRALLPLTTSAHSGGTPPIIAILQEPPFSEGGLADRVVADLKLGFGFGFSDGGKTVGILDARKEFGPDPGLDYQRIPDAEAVNFALATEGPVGLTFDVPRADAAAFSNSIISMTPAHSDGTVIERKYQEHFAGISLRRYLAPEWLTDQVDTKGCVSASECHWFELAHGYRVDHGVVFKCGGIKVLRANAGHFEVRTVLIDQSGRDAGKRWVPVAPSKLECTYSLLHAPVAPNRYSASIFLSRNESEPSIGTTNQPLLIASFEWSLPKQVPNATVLAPEGKALHCIASFPTSLAWGRTSRDFQTIVIEPLKLNSDDVVKEVAADALIARIKDGGLRFEIGHGAAQSTITVRPSTLPEFILYRHRHLAIIGTRPAAGLGKPVQVFAGSAMVRPRANTVPVSTDLSVATQVHLAEYEVRSQPLASAFSLSWTRDFSIPDMAAIGYVDLTATGAAWDRELWLFIRFASEARRDKFPRLGLRIELPDVATVDANGEQIIKAQEVDGVGVFNTVFDLPANQAAFGAELLLLPYSDGITKIVLILVLADGQRQPIHEQKFTRPKDTGFILSLAADSEFWTDFSMLHFPSGHMTKSPNVWDFNFELLFSKTSDLPPADAVRSEHIYDREEVQARVVSVSPPIPVVR